MFSLLELSDEWPVSTVLYWIIFIQILSICCDGHFSCCLAYAPPVVEYIFLGLGDVVINCDVIVQQVTIPKVPNLRGEGYLQRLFDCLGLSLVCVALCI